MKKEFFKLIIKFSKVKVKDFLGRKKINHTNKPFELRKIIRIKFSKSQVQRVKYKIIINVAVLEQNV